jgi:hypothetical protein
MTDTEKVAAVKALLDDFDFDTDNIGDALVVLNTIYDIVDPPNIPTVETSLFLDQWLARQYGPWKIPDKVQEDYEEVVATSRGE